MTDTQSEVTFTAGVRDTTEGPVYTVSGEDWDAVTAEIVGNERVVVNMVRSTRAPTGCCG